MTNDFEKNCAHCPGGIGLQFPLYSDDLFLTVCDVHPLTEGHILLITKKHVLAMGALSNSAFARYQKLYKKIKTFIMNNYGQVGIFEHGVSGQTVPHAHTHFLPFNHSTEEIIPDQHALRPVANLSEIRNEFLKNKEYLFLENRDRMWLVKTKLSYPRFFREIFAKLLKADSRADWKKAEDNKKLMEKFSADIFALKNKWSKTNLHL